MSSSRTVGTKTLIYGQKFEAKLPARKFRKYKCVGSSAILEEKLDRKSTEEVVFSDEKVCTSLPPRDYPVDEMLIKLFFPLQATAELTVNTA